MGEILVSRYEDNFETLGGRLAGKGSDQIVGLGSRPGEGGNPEHFDHALHIGDLGDHILGRGIAVGLVGVVHLMPEGGLGPVERDGGVIGGLLAEDADEHPGKRHDSARGKPFGVRETLAHHGVVGSEHIAHAVDEIYLLRFLSH